MTPLIRSASHGLRRALRPAAPLVRAARLWSDADGGRMSAAMSFYGVLSLAPLLLLLVAVLGWWVDRQMLEGRLTTEIGTIVGPQGSALMEHALASARKPGEGLLASAAGLIVLLSGATGVFGELQAAFERLWSSGNTTAAPQQWWHGTSLRLRGIGYVMAFGFLLLVSLVISTLLNLASVWAGAQFALAQSVRLLSEVLAFAICVGLFFGLMRMSGGSAKPRQSSLLLGAVVGATLFTTGRQVLAVYLSGAAVVSAYGAAGSLVVLLIWIYFSSAVLLFGAASAKAVEERRVALEARQAPPGAGLHAP